MRLRQARAADAPAIANVFLACWRDAYTGVVPKPVLIAMDAKAALQLWKQVLGQPTAGGETVVAETSGAVTGVIRFGRDPDDAAHGHVFSLYVDPAAGRSGVGGALMERGLSWFRTQGLDEATLWVFEANAPARAFYARHGWAPDGGTRVEPEFQAPEIRLRRRL